MAAGEFLAARDTPQRETRANKLERDPSGLPPNGKKLSGQGRAKLTFQKEAISGSMNIRFFLAVPKTQLLPSGLQLDSEAMKVSEAGGDNPETDTALPQ